MIDEKSIFTNEDLKTREFIPLKEKIEIWSDSFIWKIENKNFFSDWLHQYIDKLKPILIKFVREGFSRNIANRNNFDYFFLRNLAYWFAKYEDIVKALFKVNGWQGRLGLEFASCNLRIFFDKHKKIPRTTDEGMINITSCVSCSQNWVDFGINHWEDLLLYSFGKEFILKRRLLKEKNKFQKAIIFLKEFQKSILRLPFANDKEVAWIISNIYRGRWKKFGINTWNDMLMEVFGEINIEPNKYKGIKGYYRAKEELIDYYKINGKLPIRDQFYSIYGAVSKGYWKDFGINSWNDILIDNFGEINNEIKFKGNKGLERAIKLLREYYERYEKIPALKSEGMRVLYIPIKRGEWSKLGINSWNDLLFYTFKEINRKPIEKCNYSGKKGLDKAIKKLKKYRKMHNKIPTSRTKGMSEILYVIQRRYWKNFGINTWNDLLYHTFGKVNYELKYKGKEGLRLAMQILRQNFQKYNKIPTTNDKGIRGIYDAVRRGEWSNFNISSWKELIKHTFGLINFTNSIISLTLK